MNLALAEIESIFVLSKRKRGPKPNRIRFPERPALCCEIKLHELCAWHGYSFSQSLHRLGASGEGTEGAAASMAP